MLLALTQGNTTTGPFAPLGSLPGNLTTRGVADTHIVEWTSDPNSWAGSSATLSSGVISIEIVDPDSGSVVPLTGSSVREPMLVSLPVSPSIDSLAFSCIYWDAAINDWSNAGTVVIGFVSNETAGTTTAVCGTLHLSEFASEESDLPFTFNAVNPFADAGELEALFDPGNIVATIVVLCVLGLFILAWILSAVYDTKRAEEMLRLHREHVRKYGDVKMGLGMDTLHLPVEDPRRIKVALMYESLRVRWLFELVCHCTCRASLTTAPEVDDAMPRHLVALNALCACA